MESAIRIQILNETEFRIALVPLGNLWIEQLPLQLLGKLEGKLGSLTFVWQPIEERENFDFKPVIDLEREGICHANPSLDMLQE